MIVLSNTDGCIVSLTKEARALGLKRGQPAFQSKAIINRHNGQVFSSNYSLYADMSARVMRLLKQFSPRVEVYSIDEAWLDLTDLGIDDGTEYGQTIKARIWQYTGLPVSVAMASTKCLAKVAMEVVKHHVSYDGVLDIPRRNWIPFSIRSLSRTCGGSATNTRCFSATMGSRPRNTCAMRMSNGFVGISRLSASALFLNCEVLPVCR